MAEEEEKDYPEQRKDVVREAITAKKSKGSQLEKDKSKYLKRGRENVKERILEFVSGLIGTAQAGESVEEEKSEERPREKSFSGTKKAYPTQRREAAAAAERFRTAEEKGVDLPDWITPEEDQQVMDFLRSEHGRTAAGKFSPEYLAVEEEAKKTNPKWHKQHWVLRPAPGHAFGRRREFGPYKELSAEEVNRLARTYSTFGSPHGYTTEIDEDNRLDFDRFLDAELRRRNDPESAKEDIFSPPLTDAYEKAFEMLFGKETGIKKATDYERAKKDEE